MTSGRDEYMASRRIDFEREREERLRQQLETGGAAHGGLTVRDYFAAKIIAAWVAADYVDYGLVDYSQNAEEAYALADAMMKERNK